MDKKAESTSLLHQIFNSSKIQESVLYNLARYIEEKHQLNTDLNYWELDQDKIPNSEYIFYINWQWLNYVEDEGLVIPPEAFQKVFGKQWKQEILNYINSNPDDMQPFLNLKDKAGEYLLAWAKCNLL